QTCFAGLQVVQLQVETDIGNLADIKGRVAPLHFRHRSAETNIGRGFTEGALFDINISGGNTVDNPHITDHWLNNPDHQRQRQRTGSLLVGGGKGQQFVTEVGHGRRPAETHRARGALSQAADGGTGRQAKVVDEHFVVEVAVARLNIQGQRLANYGIDDIAGCR